MVRYRDGLAIATNVVEAAAWHKSIKVACPYGHITIFNGDGLWWLCISRNLPLDFPSLRNRLYCRECLHLVCRKVSPSRIDACGDAPTTMLPHPPEHEARAAAKRFR